MGQYYKPFLIGEHNKQFIINPHEYDNGMKLMEHSYVGNYVTNAVRTLLLNQRKRVAWMGDYADTECGDAYEKKLPHDKFMQYWKACWGDHPKKCDHPYSMDYDETNKGWYLINHTQKCFIEMDAYIAESTVWETWGGKKVPVIIDPLPLLTACGNDRGGGDFHKGCIGYENVGIWAFDVLEFSQTTVPNYERKSFVFIE